jgi:ATP-dependent helicase HrpA
LRDQLAALFSPGFLVLTPWDWLQQYPRYLQAMQLRWQKGTTGGFQKDRQQQQLIARYWQTYLGLQQQPDLQYRPDLTLLRWLIEEFHVATFAQQLRTVVPVSEKRLRDLIDTLTRPQR